MSIGTIHRISLYSLERHDRYVLTQLTINQHDIIIALDHRGFHGTASDLYHDCEPPVLVEQAPDHPNRRHQCHNGALVTSLRGMKI